LACLSYDWLTRSIYIESSNIADASVTLVSVTYELDDRRGVEGGDLLEAEMLARKSIHIREKISGSYHRGIEPSLSTLERILRLKGNHDDEVKALLERLLIIAIKSEGAISKNVIIANNNLGVFHSNNSHDMPSGDARTEVISLAESYFKEAVRISSIIYGPTHHQTLEYESVLSTIRQILELEDEVEEEGGEQKVEEEKEED
jgi:hypothetical protein